MQNRQKNNWPTELRLIFLLSALIVALFALLVVSKLIEQANEPTADNIRRAPRAARPVRVPGETNEPFYERTITRSQVVPNEPVATDAGTNVVSNEKDASSPPSVISSRHQPEQPSRNPGNGGGQWKGAVLTGTISFDGQQLINPVVDLRDPICSKLHTNVVRMPFYAVGTNGGLADVVVYLKEGVQRRESRREPLVIEQRNCQFWPYVSVVQAGQPIVFKNTDRLLHNVHSTPVASGNLERNRILRPDTAVDLSFPKPEMFLRIKCDVHPWMFAYVSVIPHPYFAVTDQDGRFIIEDIPLGHYVIEAVHRKLGSFQHELDVKSRKEVIGIDFTFRGAPRPEAIQQQAKIDR